jgi:hypothetical protein
LDFSHPWKLQKQQNLAPRVHYHWPVTTGRIISKSLLDEEELELSESLEEELSELEEDE